MKKSILIMALLISVSCTYKRNCSKVLINKIVQIDSSIYLAHSASKLSSSLKNLDSLASIDTIHLTENTLHAIRNYLYITHQFDTDLEKTNPNLSMLISYQRKNSQVLIKTLRKSHFNNPKIFYRELTILGFKL